PYTSATLIVRTNSNGIPGTGNVMITATSQTIPEITSSVDFVQHTGLDILVVDDDDGDDYESYFTAALEPLSEAALSGVWDATHNLPSVSDLAQVNCVIWMTGNSSETLSESDQTTLAAFLDDGGSLILSGQKIGFDLGHPDPGTSFFTDYLHADFITPYYQGHTVYGVMDDPISGGMSFDIYGGTGANNQTSQADIDPLDAIATTFLTYSEGSYERNAALRIETGTYRAIYLAFGFEGIADEYNPNLLMAHMLYWLGTISAVEPEASLPPASFNLGEGFPNPFNPVVSIPYTLAERTPVRLSVYDLLGREVAVLVSETMNPGTHLVQWDASALSSGVYFSRLTAGSQTAPAFTATKKLILLK
ncbi:T9SS type A sorting domain-containing protein, partial [bacterium]|nr:T9SS type A sorting domain-containing protein [bacterium]